MAARCHLSQKSIADNANSDEENNRFCKWKSRRCLGKGWGGKKSHLAGSQWRIMDPFTGGTIPISLAGEQEPVKTTSSHAPLPYAYPSPFPISVLPALSPSFPSRSALVLCTSSSLSYLLGSVFSFPFSVFWEHNVPHSGKPCLLHAEDGCNFPPYLSCPVAPPNLPPQLQRAQLPAREFPAPAEELPPAEDPWQVLAADYWLIGVRWAAWEMCSQPSGRVGSSPRGAPASQICRC